MRVFDKPSLLGKLVLGPKIKSWSDLGRSRAWTGPDNPWTTLDSDPVATVSGSRLAGKLWIWIWFCRIQIWQNSIWICFGHIQFPDSIQKTWLWGCYLLKKEKEPNAGTKGDWPLFGRSGCCTSGCPHTGSLLYRSQYRARSHFTLLGCNICYAIFQCTLGKSLYKLPGNETRQELLIAPTLESD